MSENQRKRGFATMTPEKRAEISSAGGKAAHASGKAHQFTSAEAVAAAKKRVSVRGNKKPQEISEKRLNETNEL